MIHPTYKKHGPVAQDTVGHDIFIRDRLSRSKLGMASAQQSGEDEERIEDALWNIFTHYSLHGNPLEPMNLKMSQWIAFCRKCQLSNPTGKPGTDEDGNEVPMQMDASVAVIYHAACEPTKQGRANFKGRSRKMKFGDFLNCLVTLAERLHGGGAEDGEGAFEQLLNEKVLPNALRREPRDVSALMGSDAVQTMAEDYQDSVRCIFEFYAGVPQAGTKADARAKAHPATLAAPGFSPDYGANSMHTKAVSLMASSLQFNEFLQFAGDFNLTCSVFLTTHEMTEIFLASLSDYGHEEIMPGLSFDDFWEALVRCAVVAYDDKDTTDLNKLRALFLYMTNRIEETIPRAVNASGRSSASTNAQNLMKGAKRFQYLVQQQWNRDGQLDYIRGHQAQRLSGHTMLARMQSRQDQKKAADDERRMHGRAQARRSRGLSGAGGSAHGGGRSDGFRDVRTYSAGGGGGGAGGGKASNGGGGKGGRGGGKKAPGIMGASGNKPASASKMGPWRAATDAASGKTYYYHKKTKQVTWIKPRDFGKNVPY